jgi:hypothetical protein
MLDRLPLNQQGKLDACGTPPRRGPRSARSRALRLLRGALLAAVLAAALASPDLALAAKRFSFAGTTSQHRAVTFQIPQSFRAVTRFSIFWSARCTSGAALVENSFASRLAFNRPNLRWTSRGMYSFTMVDPGYSAANGRSLTFTVTVTGNGRIPLKHLPTGIWIAHAVVTDPTTGQPIDTCDTGKVTWKADVL